MQENTAGNTKTEKGAKFIKTIYAGCYKASTSCPKGQY